MNQKSIALIFTLLVFALLLPAYSDATALHDHRGENIGESAALHQLQDIRRIVFLGDSITQAGEYVVDIECWLLSRGCAVEVLNLGLGSETASDLTDAENAGHVNAYDFGRPAISERLERVLTATKPDMLVACYGMNDGGSLPADDSGLERFSAAITGLRDAALNSGVKRVVLCTPPVHDSKETAPGRHDENLARYSEWMLSKRAEGWEVVDLHGPMRAALDAERARDPGFVFAKDGVHPGREGHWNMARSFLQQFLGENLDGVSSSEQLFNSNGDSIRELVREKMRVLFGAWMSSIGHNRPGVAGGPDASPGIPVNEAEAKAAELTGKIKAMIAPNAKPDVSGHFAPDANRLALTWRTSN